MIKRLLENSSVIIAIFTAYVYLMAYAKIFIEAHYYKVPIELLNMGLLDLTYAAVVVFWFFFLFNLFFLIVISSYNSIFKWLRVASISLFFIAIIIYLVVIYFEWFGSDDWIQFVVTALCLLVLLGWSLRFDIKGAFTEGKLPDESIFFKIYFIFKNDIKLSTPFLIWEVVAFSLFFLSHSFISLQSGVEYDTFYKDGCYASLKYTPDILLTKKITNGKLEDGFFIFKTESIEKINISKRNINSTIEMATCGSPSGRVVEPHSANR